MKTVVTWLINRRMGVPSFRVLRITWTTRVRMALSFTPLVTKSKSFPRPTALVHIPVLGAPLAGSGLLASTSLLIQESFLHIALLMVTWSFGPIISCRFRRIRLMGTLPSRFLGASTAIAVGRSFTSPPTVLDAPFPVPLLSNCLSRTKETTMSVVLKQMRGRTFSSS